jgi:transposase
VAGERDPVQLAQHRNPACKSPTDLIAKALTGTWKDEQRFVLQHALMRYDAYTTQRAACDRQFEQMLKRMESRTAHPAAPLPDLPPAKGTAKSNNRPSFNARSQVARIVGVAIAAVTGIAGGLAQTILSEIGSDMRCFPTVKPFCSWLGLAPRNDSSSGKVLRSYTVKVRSRANQAVRMAAQSVARSDTALGAYVRTMRARKGPQQAIVATAHKIARTVYHRLKTGEAYEEESAAAYEAKRQEREIKHRTRRATKLDYTLAPMHVVTLQTAP